MLFIESNHAAIINAAVRLNFWGKRLQSVKLDCARTIIEELDIKSISGEQLADFLENNKPEKQKKERAEYIPTFSGSVETIEQQRPRLPINCPVIITAAQQDTAVNIEFLNALQSLAFDLKAQIKVVPMKYNTNGFMGEKQPELLHESIREFALINPDDEIQSVWYGSTAIHGANVLPTAKVPVNAAETLIGSASLSVLPHTRQQFKTLPRAKGAPARFAITTGAVTYPRYVQNKRAGIEAEQEHVFGAVVLFPDGTFQQVEYKSGEMYFRGRVVSNTGLSCNYSDNLGIVLGDLHSEKIDSVFFGKTISLISEMQPRYIVCHDIFDFTSRNHHNIDSGRFLASQQFIGASVSGDLEKVSAVLAALQMAAPNAEIVIVNSNHDDALDRWLDSNKYNPKIDPVNAPIYYGLNHGIYTEILGSGELKYPVVLERALRFINAAINFDSIRFLELDESYLINGVEVGYHGHNGINGARGSAGQYIKLGQSMVSGHTHSLYKQGSVTVTGVTGSLDMGYNKGFSTWSQGHVIIEPNSSTQIIIPA